MMLPRWPVPLLLLALTPSAASAQNHVVISTKDGYILKGLLREKIRGGVFDKESGRFFPLMSGEFLLHDEVRSITFNTGQVLKVDQIKPGQIPNPPYVGRLPFPTNTALIKDYWVLERFGDWDEKGDRFAYFKAAKGEGPTLKQRIAGMTPQVAFTYTVAYNWSPMYSTRELGPKYVRAWLENAFAANKELAKLKPAQKYVRIAGFLQEAGWFKEAEEELVNITLNFPDEKATAEQMLAKLRKDQAELFVESIEHARKVGQHEEALARLGIYSAGGYAKIVAPDYVDRARNLEQDYARDKQAIEEARRFLKELPSRVTQNRASWTKAAAFIAGELGCDTIERLEEFLRQARQWERQRKEKVELTHDAEQVLTFGVTSWLQGKDSFDKDPQVGLNLVHARETILKYLATEDPGDRARLLKGLAYKKDLPIDVLIKLIRSLPPIDPLPADQLDTSVQSLKLDSGTYYLQLPPGYHHQRAYPVLVVCHSGRESAEDTMKRVADEAARNGYIVVAPQWTGKKAFGSGKYSYGAANHALVLDTIRALRRRLQVDSDRVFLFGWEDGASMAFDIALGHPDQFAGVIPMSGAVTPFARHWYWTNAMYLPFYVIEGQANSAQAAEMQKLIKDWSVTPFSTLYIEYRGRPSEWFGAEVPTFFKWMGVQKRQTPLRDLGYPSLKGGLGREFRSSRNSDTRFYWLTTDAIDGRCQMSHTAKLDFKYQPASFQASLSNGNVLDKGADKAKIWKRVVVRTTGLKHVTLWVTPEMNFPDKVELIVNGVQRGGMLDFAPKVETLLEELYQSGDRQRLFIGRFDIKI